MGSLGSGSIRFCGGQRSGIRKIVGDRGNLGDGAETGTLEGVERTGAGQAKSVDGGIEVTCCLACTLERLVRQVDLLGTWRSWRKSKD